MCNQGISAVLERIGRLVCQKKLLNDAIAAPELAIFCIIHIGMNCLGIQWVLAVLLFQPFGGLIIIARFQIIL